MFLSAKLYLAVFDYSLGHNQEPTPQRKSSSKPFQAFIEG